MLILPWSRLKTKWCPKIHAMVFLRAYSTYFCHNDWLVQQFPDQIKSNWKIHRRKAIKKESVAYVGFFFLIKAYIEFWKIVSLFFQFNTVIFYPISLTLTEIIYFLLMNYKAGFEKWEVLHIYNRNDCWKFWIYPLFLKLFLYLLT